MSRLELVAAELVGAEHGPAAAPGPCKRLATSTWGGSAGVQTSRDQGGDDDQADQDAAGDQGRRQATLHALAPNARVEQAIAEVDQEVDDEHDGRQQHDQVLDDDQVAIADRLEQQPAEAGQHEDVFDDDGADQQAT